MKTVSTTITNGVQTVFPVSFVLGYIDKSHIFVYTGDVYTEQVGYTWKNATTIETNTVLPAGTSLKIRRVVPKQAIINDYTNNAILEEGNLDNSFKQALMWLEEIADGYVTDQDVWVIRMSIQMMGNIDMNGYKIFNLPEPLSPTEPVRLVDFNNLLAKASTSVTIKRTSAPSLSIGDYDHATHYICSNPTSCKVTVRKATTVEANNVSVIVFFTQLAEGFVEIVAGEDVTLVYPEDSAPVTYGKGSTIAVEAISNTHWLVVGSLGY